MLPYTGTLSVEWSYTKHVYDCHNLYFKYIVLHTYEHIIVNSCYKYEEQNIGDWVL